MGCTAFGKEIKKGDPPGRTVTCSLLLDVPIGWELQRRRPLPAAETGRSCWGRGQQDASAVQGTKRMLGAATRGTNQSPTGLIACPAGAEPPCSNPPGRTVTCSLLLDIPTDWEPRTNQSPTGALIAFAALGMCCSNPPGSIKELPIHESVSGVLGATGRIRTSGLPGRSRTLYPAELRSHIN